METEKLTLTVKEAGAKLGLSRGSMYEAIQRNEIPHLHIGRRILIPHAALIRLLEEATTPPLETGSK